MKTYYGKCQITCSAEKCKKNLKNIMPSCLLCAHGSALLIDLSGKALLALAADKKKKK